MKKQCSMSRAAALVFAAGACAGVSASPTNPNPRDLVQGELVFPIAGEDHQTQVFIVGNDGLVMPDHPPIDQIPPMPMPEYVDLDGLPGDDSVMFYDATTGQTTVLPMSPRSGQETGELPGYEGLLWDGVSSEAQGVENFGFMSLAGSLDSYPRSPNCKLVMKFTDTTGALRYFVCSGSMNDAGVVLTAAHCVYARTADGPDIFDWADAIWVYPAWDGSGDTSDPVNTQRIENFGWCTMSGVIAGSDWVNNGNFDRDCAAIRVDDRNIGMLTGWFGWSWGGCDTDSTHYNFSYPSEDCSATLHNGQDMYYWDGTFDSCPGNQLHLDTNSGCLGAVWGGMSGSGAYHISSDTRYVHAVCSTSNRSDSANYCKLWEQFTTDMESLKTGARGASFDLEALRFRVNDTSIQAGTSFSDGTVYLINATNNNPAAQNITLRVYLSTNADISTGDTLLATWIYNLNFGTMHSYLASIPATTIPVGTAPGTYYLGIVIDSGTDGNSGNNDTDGWDCIPISVTLGLPAAPSGPSPADNATGISTVADLDWTAAARATSYDVYFGTDSTPDAGEFQGNTAGSSWALPNLASNTHYYWQVIARNSAGTAAGPIWDFTTATPPDLNAISCDAPDAPNNVFYRGTQNISVVHATRNDGQTTSPSYLLEFRASTNTIISTADLLLETRNYGALGAGSTRTVNSFVDLPGTMSPGTYYIGTRIIPDDGSSGSYVSDTDTITVLACRPDLTGSTDPNSAAYGIPDAVLDASDFFYYLDLFVANNAAADYTGSSDPNDPEYGLPDGIIDASDFFFYLDLYTAGCPGI